MKPKHEQETGLDAIDLLHILTAFDSGDFSKRLPDKYIGVEGKIAVTLNSIIQKNAILTQELKRIGKEVQVEGKVRQNITLESGIGAWSETVDAVNDLVDNLLVSDSGIEDNIHVGSPILLRKVSGTWYENKDDLSFRYINHT
jgi:hypothetical protein